MFYIALGIQFKSSFKYLKLIKYFQFKLFKIQDRHNLPSLKEFRPEITSKEKMIVKISLIFIPYSILSSLKLIKINKYRIHSNCFIDFYNQDAKVFY